MTDIGELIRAGREHERSGSLADALESYGQADWLARQARAPGLRAEILCRMGTAARNRGHPDEAEPFFALGAQEALIEGDHHLVGKAINGLGTCAHVRGDLSQATAWYTEAHGRGVKGESKRLMAMCLQNLGVVEVVHGNLEAAANRLEAAKRLFQDLGDTEGVFWVTTNLGRMAAQDSRWRDALLAFEEALGAAAPTEDCGRLALGFANVGRALIELDMYGPASDAIDRSLEAANTIGAAGRLAEGFWLQGVLCLAQGNPAAAAEILARAETVVGSSGDVLLEGEVLRDLGLSAARMGQVEEARRHWISSLQNFQHVGAVKEALHVRALLQAA